MISLVDANCPEGIQYCRDTLPIVNPIPDSSPGFSLINSTGVNYWNKTNRVIFPIDSGASLNFGSAIATSISGSVALIGSSASIGGCYADTEGSCNGFLTHADSSGVAGGSSSSRNHADSSGIASGNRSHADSGGTTTNIYSHADSTGVASGYYSHADTQGQAQGVSSNAHGNTQAQGTYSSSFGNSVTSVADYTFSFGYNFVNYVPYSFMSGGNLGYPTLIHDNFDYGITTIGINPDNAGYSYGSQLSVISPNVDYSCTGSITACSDLSTSACSYYSGVGCYTGQCVGNPNLDCSALSQTDCEYYQSNFNGACTANFQDQCQDSPSLSCSSLTESDCYIANSYGACAYNSLACTGTITYCNQISDSTACSNAGCVWDSGYPRCDGYDGSSNFCESTYFTQNDCDSNGCNWDGSVCTKYVTTSDCNTVLSFAYPTSSCSSYASPCSQAYSDCYNQASQCSDLTPNPSACQLPNIGCQLVNVFTSCSTSGVCEDISDSYYCDQYQSIGCIYDTTTCFGTILDISCSLIAYDSGYCNAENTNGYCSVLVAGDKPTITGRAGVGQTNDTYQCIDSSGTKNWYSENDCDMFTTYLTVQSTLTSNSQFISLGSVTNYGVTQLFSDTYTSSIYPYALDNTYQMGTNTNRYKSIYVVNTNTWNLTTRNITAIDAKIDNLNVNKNITVNGSIIINSNSTQALLINRTYNMTLIVDTRNGSLGRVGVGISNITRFLGNNVFQVGDGTGFAFTQPLFEVDTAGNVLAYNNIGSYVGSGTFQNMIIGATCGSNSGVGSQSGACIEMQNAVTNPFLIKSRINTSTDVFIFNAQPNTTTKNNSLIKFQRYGVNYTEVDYNGNWNFSQNVVIQGNFSVKRPYAVFTDNLTQTMPSTAQGYPINFSTVEDNYLIQRQGISNITVQQSGDYLFEVSALFECDNNNKHVNIWWQKNGINVARSNTRQELSTANVEALMTIPFIIDLNQSDNLRIMWSSDSTGCTIKYITNTSFVPETPSVILTITKISEITP